MAFQLRSFRLILGVAALVLALAVSGCSGGSTPSPSPTPVVLAVTIGSTSVVVPQDGTGGQLSVAISGPIGSPTVTVDGLPAGITAQFAATGAGPSGTLTFTASAAVPAGNYPASVTVSLAGQSASKNFSVVSAVVAKVLNVTDSTLGVSGHLQQFMSTNFQIA